MRFRFARLTSGSQPYPLLTDLLLNGVDSCTDEQIAVFDDVLLHLIKRVETKALVELGRRLAPIEKAPYGVIGRLGRHDDIAVAAPVLAQSTRLTDDDLVEIAGQKGQAHLTAIAGRARLPENVTDALLKRGDQTVVHQLAGNAGASFSEFGFYTLLRHAEKDESLAKKVGVRVDLPPHLLGELLSKATEAVRAYISAAAPNEARDDIDRVMASVSDEVMQEAIAPRDFASAREHVLFLKQRRKLNEATVLEFAKMRRHEEMVVSLAELCGAPVELVERLVQSARCEGLQGGRVEMADGRRDPQQQIWRTRA